MSNKRVPLYERLPEIYRVKDAASQPSEQLKNYLSIVEDMLGEIHRNIEGLYDDFFIETCAEWVIPYIGDLLGVSQLKGEAWTLRADTAQTINLRRRKGTISALEHLTYNLTGWGIYCKELRNNMVWNQHLNHQRPDEGGEPPYDNIGTVGDNLHKLIPRGGTMPLRNRAVCSLLGTAFDSFAHVADVKPAVFGQVRYNIPNLAVFFWRCKDYTVPAVKPHQEGAAIELIDADGNSRWVIRFYADPLGRPTRLYNRARFDTEEMTGERSLIHSMPSPMPSIWAPGGFAIARPDDFCFIESYDGAEPPDKLDVLQKAFGLHLPKSEFVNTGNDEEDDRLLAENWTFRLAKLDYWEDCLEPEIMINEAVIDPYTGRFVVCVETEAQKDALEESLRATYTYGAPGPVGAHPTPQKTIARDFGETVIPKKVHWSSSSHALETALDHIANENLPVDIEIQDSGVYELDLSRVLGTISNGGNYYLPLNKSLVIRAADNERPIIKLITPLRFRPKVVHQPGTEAYKTIKTLSVFLDGLFITRAGSISLIEQSALNLLKIENCTLDPGGFLKPDNTYKNYFSSIVLDKDYGLIGSELQNFNEIPEIIIERSIAGALEIDLPYNITLKDSILDAGNAAAVRGITQTESAPLKANRSTIYGTVDVQKLNANGMIFKDTLTVLNNQTGCIEYSYIASDSDRIPMNHACVFGQSNHKPIAKLHFNSEIFGRSTYGQLHYNSDIRIRREGPNADAMGAYGFLQEEHKLKNINIRYQEYMPLGIKPILIPADTLDA